MPISIKNTATALVATAIATPLIALSADARPTTRSFTCDGVRDFIYERGAVVMDTKSRSIYRRFVSNINFCQREETTKRFRVPTRDGSCRLLICVEKQFRRFGD